jgi:His-Xaa-Ser system protein HxsD
MDIKTTILQIDSKIYSKKIVFACIDALSSEYVFSVSIKNGNYRISIKPRFEIEVDRQKLASIIYDELNNQVARNVILSANKNLREIIVGQALLGTEAFYDVHPHFNIAKYSSQENYILDENKINQIFDQYETK